MAIAELGYKINTGGLTQGERALDRFGKANDKAGAAAMGVSGGVGVAAKSAGLYAKQAKAATGQTANLTAQFNDIGVMLAAGQNPLQLALQQGTQINQVFAQMGGGANALRGIGAGIASMLNPLSLLTIGVIAGGAALVQWGISAIGASDDTYKLKDAISDLGDETQDAVAELDMLERGLNSLAEARIAQEIDKITKRINELDESAEAYSARRGRAFALQSARSQKELDELNDLLDAANKANEALKDREKLLEAAENVSKAAEMTNEYAQQAELSNAIAEFGRDSAQVEAIKRDHALQSVNAYITQNQLSGQVAQELRNGAMAAYDADVNVTNAANSLREAESAARGMASAIASAAGFSTNISASVDSIKAEIEAVKGGADAAIAGQIASMRIRADSILQQQLEAGVAKEVAEAAHLSQQAQISEYEELLKARKELIKVTKVGGSSSVKSIKKVTEALTEAEKSAKKFADTMDGYVADAIGGVVDWMVDGFKGGLGTIWDLFTNTIKQMIAFALKNKIMISMGLGGSAMGGVANAAAGGGAAATGGILGTFGTNVFGGGAFTAGTGLMGGLGTTLNGMFGAGGSILGGLSSSFGAIGGIFSGGGLSALGAAIPALGLVGFAISGLFGKTKQLDQGLQINIDNLDATVKAYNKIQKSKFWGLSKKTRTTLDDVADSVSDPIVDAVSGIQTGIMDMASVLGIGSDAFDGFSSQLKISFKGLETEEEKLEAIQDALANLGNDFAGMISGLDEFAASGEGAADTLSRLVNRVGAVNTMWDRLGFSLYELSLSGADAASSIVDLYGDLDNFTASTGAYYNAFFSDSERLNQAVKEMGTSLAELGIDVMPKSNAAFRALVEAADAAGNDALVANLIQLAGGFNEITAATASLSNTLRASDFATEADFQYATARRASGESGNVATDMENMNNTMSALLEKFVTLTQKVVDNTGVSASEAVNTRISSGVVV